MDFITFSLLLVAALVIALNVAGLYWFGAMLLPLVAGGGPYVPTPPESVAQMIEEAKISPSDVVADLGSGDGRILIEALKAGAKRAIGYEIHPGLVKLSRFKASTAGLADRFDVRRKSFWKADLSDCSIVFLYQIPYAMGKIETLLKRTLPKGSRVVSYAFPCPNLTLEHQSGDVYVYRI